MPFYQFSCTTCNHSQEHLLKVGTVESNCPKCNSTEYHKQVSAHANVNIEKSKLTPCGKEISQVKQRGCASSVCGCA